MSDDLFGRERPEHQRDDEPWDDLGDPVFADSAPDDPPLRFGPDDTGPLPHWTAPPTGEIPRIFAEKDHTEDLDVWSSFAQQAPVWRETAGAHDETSVVSDLGVADLPRMGALDERPGAADPFFDLDEPAAFAEPELALIAEPDPIPEVKPKREPIRIGSDPTGEGPTGMRTRQTNGPSTRGTARREPDESRGQPRPGARPTRPTPTGGTAGRDMPTAIAAGLGLAAVFVLLTRFTHSTGVMALVVAVLGLGAIEFYEKTQERGYRPATVTGVVAAVLIPLAAYWRGETGIVVGIFLAAIATMVTMMGFPSVDSGPLPNAAVTLLGVVWIGVLGGFAGLILQSGTLGARANIGTDTIFALVIAVVANDVGALLIGSAGGKTPVRAWISPNKTVEGLIGGAIVSVGAMVLLSVVNTHRTTWVSLPDCILLGLVVAVLAPIGDFTESMFKRNLDIKDFGTLLPGHGGILDRFDGFLFTLPAAYYLLITLEPFTHVNGK